MKLTIPTVILLLSTFIAGLAVSAKPDEPRIGQYQLVAASYTAPLPEPHLTIAVYRLNTATGEVEKLPLNRGLAVER